jgi:hypothetical protein
MSPAVSTTGGAASVPAPSAFASTFAWFCLTSVSLMLVLPLAVAATLADVLPSAARSTNEISRNVALRTTLAGPLNSRPFTRTAWSSRTNSNCSTDAPMDAFQGKPFLASATTSRAACPVQEIRPLARSLPSWMRTDCVCPTRRLVS